MLDFRPRVHARQYLSRREQRRLFFWVMGIGLIVIAASIVADVYRYGLSHGVDAAFSVDTRFQPPPNQTTEPNSIAIARAEAPNPTPNSEAGSFGVDADLLARVRDDTPWVRNEEIASWLNVWSVLSRSTDNELARGSIGAVSFVELFQQPQAYRGKLVKIRGVARQATYVQAAENGSGVEGYYRLIVRLDHGPAEPVFLYTLALPAGFPMGEQIRADLEANGFFFKRMVYPTQEDGQLRRAPVIMAKTASWIQARAISSSRNAWVTGAVIGSIAVGVVILLLVSYWAASKRSPHRELLPAALPAIDDGDVSSVSASLRNLAGGGLMNRVVGLFLFAAVLFACWQISAARGHAKTPAERTDDFDARKLFDAFGLDEAAFKQLAHAAPLAADERTLLARVLMRLPQIKPADVERWTKGGVLGREISNEPEKYERTFVRLDGRVNRVTRLVPPAEIQDRFAMDVYYRCEMALGDEAYPAVVFARAVPKKWRVDEPMNARATANALFLKVGPKSAAGHNELHFAADRVAWHPDTELGNLGMDYGLFDTVEQLKPITNQERECFYQMLAAVGRANSAESGPHDVETASHLGPLLRAPNEYVGELHAFRGVARSAVKVHVNDPDIVRRFGFDHYFELVVFLDLEGMLDVAGKKVGSYPVVYCLRELPADMPIGDNIGEVVEASGFFLKKWPYTTQMTEEKSPGLRMFSPLLIGKTAMWLPPRQAESLVGPIAGGVLAAVIACVGLFACWYSRRERRARRELFETISSPERNQSLDDISFEVPER